MPTVDLLLPPQGYSAWRRTRAVTPHNRFMPLNLIATWIERIRQRAALAALDDHTLRDIGITRVEAARECGKPFWR